jgi:hypothetical protein
MKPPEFGQPELSNNESEAIHNIKHANFLECPLYQHDRTSLFNYFNNIVPISIEYILFECNEISEFGQPELSNNESEAIHNIKHVKKAC